MLTDHGRLGQRTQTQSSYNRRKVDRTFRGTLEFEARPELFQWGISRASLCCHVRTSSNFDCGRYHFQINHFKDYYVLFHYELTVRLRSNVVRQQQRPAAGRYHKAHAQDPHPADGHDHFRISARQRREEGGIDGASVYLTCCR